MNGVGIRDRRLVSEDEQLLGSRHPCGQVLVCARTVPSFVPGTASSARRITESTFERLFKHMELLVQLGQLLSLAADLAHGVQHCRVVAATKQFADFR